MVSIVPLAKPLEIRNDESLSYKALGACFKPYKSLSSLKTKSECVGSTNPGGYSTYTSSSISPFKNALLTSIWKSLKSL